MNTIGKRLREEREQLGKSQTEFGTLGGVLKGAQINYEQDKRQPDAAYLAAIAAAGADVLYILTGARSGQTQSTQEAMNPGRLRMAVILTEDAAAVRQLTPEQRADMILSFYQRLSKGDVQ